MIQDGKQREEQRGEKCRVGILERALIDRSAFLINTFFSTIKWGTGLPKISSSFSFDSNPLVLGL